MMEARRKLTSLPEELEGRVEDNAIAVTRRGKPVLAIMTWEFFETIYETLEIMGDEGLMRSLRQSIKEIREGKSISLGNCQKGAWRLKYGIEITPTALDMLKDIKDRRITRQIVERIDRLQDDPENEGKPLLGELSGYRSVRAAGQRFRVIFKVEDKTVVVIIIAVGLRKEGDKKDIYRLARKMIQLNLIEPSLDT